MSLYRRIDCVIAYAISEALQVQQAHSSAASHDHAFDKQQLHQVDQ